MAKFKYDKYTIVKKTIYEESAPYSSYFYSDWSEKITVYSSYSFDSSNGIFKGLGYGQETTARYLSHRIDCFDITSSQKYVHKIKSVEQMPGSTDARVCVYTEVRSTIEKTIPTRDSIMQTNIVAENGTYPDNGVHTDGYWYVKKEEVFYYDKYNVDTKIKYIEKECFTDYDWAYKKKDKISVQVAKSYTLNEDTGKYYFSNITDNIRDSSGPYYMSIMWGETNKLDKVEVNKAYNSLVKFYVYDDTEDDWGLRFKTYETEKTEIKVRGSLSSSNITATNGTYPDNGIHTDGYWYVKKSQVNSIPTISGKDENLGDKNLEFSIFYVVDDINFDDNLIVTEKLNGEILRSINGAPRNEILEVRITDDKILQLEANSTNTIEIKVDDGKGGIAYRRYTFKRVNIAPIISGNDENLGEKIEPFSLNFSVTDVENNPITVSIFLDSIKKEEYAVDDGATNTFTLSKEDWFKLSIGNHTIKVQAQDSYGATTTRVYTFIRQDNKIQVMFKKPIETDITAKKILITPTWVIPKGAEGKVEICNNGFDEVPIWEDITTQVFINRHYNIQNDKKTADKWGINVRITIEKGTSTDECSLKGFGGAFE